MSNKFSKKVWDHEYPVSIKLTYLALAYHANEYGKWNVTHEELRRLTGLSELQLNKALKKLEDDEHMFMIYKEGHPKIQFVLK